MEECGIEWEAVKEDQEEGDVGGAKGLWDKVGETEMWAVSQLAVTGADEPRVVQLGASLSPESRASRD